MPKRFPYVADSSFSNTVNQPLTTFIALPWSIFPFFTSLNCAASGARQYRGQSLLLLDIVPGFSTECFWWILVKLHWGCWGLRWDQEEHHVLKPLSYLLAVFVYPLLLLFYLLMLVNSCRSGPIYMLLIFVFSNLEVEILMTLNQAITQWVLRNMSWIVLGYGPRAISWNYTS